MTEPRFRLVSTTADIGLFVWGRTDAELFQNAACGLSRVLAMPRGIVPSLKRSVRVRGIDEEARLVAWLSEWLYLFDTEGFIGSSFRVDAMEGGTVVGAGWGVTYDPRRHRLLKDVKGVTYHALEIGWSGPRKRARLVLDI